MADRVITITSDDGFTFDAFYVPAQCEKNGEKWGENGVKKRVTKQVVKKAV